MIENDRNYKGQKYSFRTDVYSPKIYKIRTREAFENLD